MPKFWNKIRHGRKYRTQKDQQEFPQHAGHGPRHRGGGHRHGRQLFIGEKALSDCQSGDHVNVVRIAGGGPIRRRLLEMGINAGTDVRVIKYAPLKDPLECEIKGYHIALRVAEAQRIIVTPEKPPGD